MLASGGSPAGDDLYSDSGKQARDGARRWPVGRNARESSGQGGRGAPGACGGDGDDGGDSDSGGSDGEFEDEEGKADAILAGEGRGRTAAGRRDALQRGHMLA